MSADLPNPPTSNPKPPAKLTLVANVATTPTLPYSSLLTSHSLSMLMNKLMSNNLASKVLPWLFFVGGILVMVKLFHG